MPGIVATATATGAGEGAAAELEIDGVSKRFGKVPVLKQVSLTVRHGEFVTLLGPSGCGKTTLLRILGGLEVADEGDVRLLGRSILSLPANQRPVNTVFQNYALFPHLSVFENIAFGLRARGMTGRIVARKVHDALEMLQLDAFMKRYPHQLSGGQKQRVALARALVNEPELLLLDEPMSALDAKLRAEVQIEIRRLQRKLGKTFILVTHDQDEAMSVSDRIMVMHNGRIEQQGTPTSVYEHPQTEFVARFLGAANLIEARRGPSGLMTPVGHLHARTTPAWEVGKLAIRPERIRITAQTPNVNGVRAVVRELVYRGDHVEVFVEPANLRLRVPAGAAPAVGRSLWLELPQEYLEVLEG